MQYNTDTIKTSNLGPFLVSQFSSDPVMELLLDSHIESGPFDGGCLIVARAIIKFVGKGKIVRIISNANHDQTQHYGALINNRIYDADGEHANWQSWIKYFSTVELVQNQQLGYAMGVDPHSSIPDSEELADQLAAMFASRYASM